MSKQVYWKKKNEELGEEEKEEKWEEEPAHMT